MTNFLSDDILEGSYRLRIRESEKLKTALELYNMEIHHKKAGPDYHRLKTMVTRCIEQNLRIENFEARNGNYERNAVVKNQGTKQRGQRTLGDCWQWKANRQCVKGDTGSFRHDTNKREKVTPSNPSPNSFMQQNEWKSSRTRSPRVRSPSGRMSRWRCKDYLKGTCTNSFCEKRHPPVCLFYKSEKGCRFGEKCSYLHPQVEEQPSKRSRRMVTKVEWLCWSRVSNTTEQGDPLWMFTHQIHDNWVAYSRIWSRRSLHRFHGRAQTYGNRSDV